MMRLLSVFRNLTPNENDSSVSTEQVYIELNEQMNEINEFKIVYKSTENIVDYFDSNAIREELSKSGNVIFIRLEVNDNFNGLSSSKVHQLSYKCINKSVLLYFESQNDRKCFIFWKSKDIQHFLSFNLVEENFGENAEEFKDFVINFIKDSLRRGHLGLHQHYKNHNKSFNVFLNYFADSRDYNLLLLAAEAGYTQFVNILLDYGLNSASLDNKINAQELALNGQHFDTLLLLLKSNLTYPASFDVTKCPENIKEFYKISLNLHEAVYSKNEEKIVKIIENNPNLCHFYNYSNESAPKIALNCKYIDIYERLLNHKIFLGKHETLNETWENFKNSERIILRKIHFNHSMYMPEKYLHDLTTNSRVAHDDPNVKAKRDLIQYSFDILNANPFTQIILMIVAASKNFQILFDFYRNSVHLLDPTANFTVKGLFYSSGRIYISAWHLMFPSTENQTFGTLAHELCHYAMKLVFKNVAKPYYRNDRKNAEIFEKIVKICFEKRKLEPIIDLVFEEYSEKMQHAELIVRVPHLIALYHDQPEKLNEIRENFIELFEFYEQIIVPEMRKNLPKIEIKNQIKKKNEKILKYKTMFYVVGVLSVIGLIVVILTVRYRPHTFNELSENDKNLVKNGKILYKNVEDKVENLFDGNYEKFNFEQISQLIDGKTLNLSFDQNRNLNDFLQNLVWKNLTKNLQEKVEKSNFNFQNKILKFQALKKISENIFENLTAEEIVDILDGKMFFIDTKNEPKLENFIDRIFVAKFEQNSQKSKNLNLNEIIEKPEKIKMLIISAEAGTGKSLTLKHLKTDIKSQNPLRWISYIDLRNITKYLNTNDLKIDKIYKILNISDDKKMQKEIFNKLFLSGNVTFLWDNVDEIYKIYGQSVLNLIQFIQNYSNNSQIISTRPLYTEILEQKFSTNSYELKFFEDDPKIFLKQFLNEKISNETVEKIENFIEKLEKGGKFEKNNRKMNVPLMINFIANAFMDNNHLNTSNFYETYKIIFDQKIKIFKQNSDFINNFFENNLNLTSKFTIREIYQKYSIMSILPEILDFNSQNLTVENFENLKIMKINFPHFTLYVEISHMDILYINSESHFRFLHKTFAEFFFAQFLIENIFLNGENLSFLEVKLRADLFLNIKKSNFNLNIFEFVKDFLQNCNNVEFYCGQVLTFLDSKADNCFKNYSEIFDFVEEFFNSSCCS